MSNEKPMITAEQHELELENYRIFLRNWNEWIRLDIIRHNEPDPEKKKAMQSEINKAWWGAKDAVWNDEFLGNYYRYWANMIDDALNGVVEE